MRASEMPLRAICILMLLAVNLPASCGQTLADFQDRFDRETNSVRKVKLLEKLGDFQFEEARRAGKAGDPGAVDLTLEKYRDNVRAALEAVKKQHPNAEKHSDGYRRLQIYLRKGIREVDETLLVAPEAYKPPLQIVRQDLNAIEEELLKLIFPRRPAEQPTTVPPAEKQP